MPVVSLRDGLGLDFEVVPEDTSAIQKYFKASPDLLFEGKAIHDLATSTLQDPATTSFQTGINVQRPVPIGMRDAGLTIEAGMNGTVETFVPDTQREDGKADWLFSRDHFREHVPVASTERYVSVGFTAALASSVSAQVSNLAFGLGADAAVTITNYQKFTITPAAPLILEAIRTALSCFQLPGDIEDLQAMRPDSIVTVSGRGCLTCSASVDLLALANPLASVELGPAVGSIGISEGASITVGTSYRLFGKYEMRVRKIGQNTIHFGYFKEHGSEFTVSASASAGVSSSSGDEDDMFAKLISAISPDAEANLQELKAGQFDANTIASIQATVQASIERTLEVGLSCEVGNLSAKEAAFLYEVDLTALDPAGRKAIQQALNGDMREILAGNPPAGIKPIRSILTNLREVKHVFKINLLGIYNFISFSKLTTKGQLLFDAETGELTLADTAIAKKITTSVRNEGGKLNQADPKQLRKVLASSFLITAAYRASGLVSTPPRLTSCHTYSEVHEKANRQTILGALNTAVGLGLISVNEQNELVQRKEEFGRTLVYARTEYSDTLARTLFLNNEKPRTLLEYESIGRRAMQIAARDDSADAFRLEPLINDELWNRMETVAQPGFRQLFGSLSNTQLGAITSDYTTIVWWAQTMYNTAEELCKLQAFTSLNPHLDPESSAFKKLRKDFAGHLKSVAADTKEEFGHPWGLIAMDMLTGNRSKARFICTGPVINLARQR